MRVLEPNNMIFGISKVELVEESEDVKDIPFFWKTFLEKIPFWQKMTGKNLA